MCLQSPCWDAQYFWLVPGHWQFGVLTVTFGGSFWYFWVFFGTVQKYNAVTLLGGTAFLVCSVLGGILILRWPTIMHDMAWHGMAWYCMDHSVHNRDDSGWLTMIQDDSIWGGRTTSDSFSNWFRWGHWSQGECFCPDSNCWFIVVSHQVTAFLRPCTTWWDHKKYISVSLTLSKESSASVIIITLSCPGLQLLRSDLQPHLVKGATENVHSFWLFHNDGLPKVINNHHISFSTMISIRIPSKNNVWP